MAVKVFFGVPGSGKTTHAAMIAARCKRKNIPCFANFPCRGTYQYESSDLGRFEIKNGVILIDEAAIDFNNRAYKSLPQDTIKYLKYYRHYGIKDIYIYSQAFDDMDITLRRLATEYYHIKRIGRWLIRVKEATKFIDIDKETHQFVDMYRWRLKMPTLVFGPLYWRMFDSWAAPELPKKSFVYNSPKSKKLQKK